LDCGCRHRRERSTSNAGTVVPQAVQDANGMMQSHTSRFPQPNQYSFYLPHEPASCCLAAESENLVDHNESDCPEHWWKSNFLALPDGGLGSIGYVRVVRVCSDLLEHHPDELSFLTPLLKIYELFLDSLLSGYSLISVAGCFISTRVRDINDRCRRHYIPLFAYQQ
jgi:hypothetical protein